MHSQRPASATVWPRTPVLARGKPSAVLGALKVALRLMLAARSRLLFARDPVAIGPVLAIALRVCLQRTRRSRHDDACASPCRSGCTGGDAKGNPGPR